MVTSDESVREAVRLLAAVQTRLEVVEGLQRQHAEEITRRLEGIQHTLHGNGSPGLKDRVAVLEEQQRGTNAWSDRLVATVLTVVAAVAAAVVAARLQLPDVARVEARVETRGPSASVGRP